MIRHTLGTVLVIAVLIAAFVLVYEGGWNVLLLFAHLRALAFILVGWAALLLVNQGRTGTVAFLRSLTGMESGDLAKSVARYSEKVVIALVVTAWIVAAVTFLVTADDISQFGVPLRFAMMSTLYAAVLYLVSAAAVGQEQPVE